jgi:hypothetical protein
MATPLDTERACEEKPWNWARNVRAPGPEPQAGQDRSCTPGSRCVLLISEGVSCTGPRSRSEHTCKLLLGEAVVGQMFKAAVREMETRRANMKAPVHLEIGP